MSAHLRAGAVSRTEDASGAAGAVHSLWSRLFCGPLKMRRVPEEAVFCTEYLFRTVEACFLHRMPHENASRTTGGLFEHGTHIPYRRRPSPVPNANHPTT